MFDHALNVVLTKAAARVEALKGKKGVTEARALVERIAAAARQHSANLAPTCHPRYEGRCEYVREWIARMATQTWTRDEHGALVGVRIPEQYHRHPALATLAAPLAMLERVKKTLLPAEYADFDRKGRGSCRSIDLYGYGYGLLLVQVRTSTRRSANGYLSVTKHYVLTDGCSSIDVPPTRIKRAAKLDSAIDSPIRALKPILPAEWSARIDADPLKLPAPGGYCPIAWKVVERRPDGSLASVYDGSPWTLGIERQERARSDHRGGLYAYPSEADAVNAAREGEIFNRRWTEGKTLVLVECETGGQYIRYANAKLAFHSLKPVRVVGAVAHP